MISSIGKTKLAGQAAFLVSTIIVLALSTQVNKFTDFFYVADLFPLAFSIITLVVVVYLFGMDLALSNAFISRAQSQIAIYGILSIFCLQRFLYFPLAKYPIPMRRHPTRHVNPLPPPPHLSLLTPPPPLLPSTEFTDERSWCKHLQALKSFVWIEFVISFLIFAITLRYAITQHTRGYKHIFSVSLVRYRPELSHAHPGHASAASFGFNGRGSEFLQFEKITEGDVNMGKY
ncbi:hypothetical protein CVT24_008280 [Panaeolus cyanescens]|uniref:Uncharacterized protein n=1 Tax=Panaeolus cyanescens TaxID=181874 RepID=A0A409YQG7_9AGAR|nr:hypothetical protein CVT24_008280 [Panaeolus cyanescens]